MSYLYRWHGPRTTLFITRWVTYTDGMDPGQHCCITRWATYTDGMDPGQHCFITRWATYTDDMDQWQHCFITRWATYTDGMECSLTRTYILTKRLPWNGGKKDQNHHQDTV